MRHSRYAASRSWIVWLGFSVLAAAICWLGSTDRVRSLIINTAWLSLATCSLTVPTGVFVGWLLERSDICFRSAAGWLLLAMIFIPLYLFAAGWEAGFGLQGWLPTAFPNWFATPWLGGWTGAIWVHSVAMFPWVALIAQAMLRSMPNESELAARLDASRWTMFWRLSWPQLLPTSIACGMWVTVVTASEITVTDLFQIRTFAEEVYIGFAMDTGFDGRTVLPAASNTATTIMLSMTLCMFAIGLLAFLQPVAGDPSADTKVIIRMGLWAFPVGLVLLMTLVFLAAVPIGSLAYKAGVMVQLTGDTRVRSWSLVTCLQMVVESPWRYRREYGWSLLIGSVAASTTVLVGWCAAVAASLGGWNYRITMLCMALLLSIPGPVLGILMIHGLNQPTVPAMVFLYDQSIFAPTVAIVFKALPIVTWMLWHGICALPKHLREAARLDGATTWQCWRFVVVPPLWPVITSAWLVALAWSLAELSVSILVVPPGVTTLAIRIFNLIHYGVEDRLAGLCLFTIVILLLLVWAMERIQRRFAIAKPSRHA